MDPIYDCSRTPETHSQVSTSLKWTMNNQDKLPQRKGPVINRVWFVGLEFKFHKPEVLSLKPATSKKKPGYSHENIK